MVIPLLRSTDAEARDSNASAVDRGNAVQAALGEDLLDRVIQGAGRADDGLQAVGEQILLSVPVAQVALVDVRKVLVRARLCDDVDSLDSFLPPRVAAMARRVAECPEVLEPATA